MLRSSPEKQSEQIAMSVVQSRSDIEEASALYSRVFGYGEQATLNSRLLRAIIESGGAAISARTAAGELVGFTYGFPGVDAGATYLYSQAAFVAPEKQGHGIGRRLKLAQKAEAIRLGYKSMRWSFDPTLARNAHLNFDILGATSRTFKRNYYDDQNSDRLIVSWDFDSESRARGAMFMGAVSPSSFGLPQADGTAGGCWITLPSNPSLATSILRVRLAVTFTDILRGSAEVISCQRVGSNLSAYRILPIIGPDGASRPSDEPDRRPIAL